MTDQAQQTIINELLTQLKKNTKLSQGMWQKLLENVNYGAAF